MDGPTTQVLCNNLIHFFLHYSTLTVSPVSGNLVATSALPLQMRRYEEQILITLICTKNSFYCYGAIQIVYLIFRQVLLYRIVLGALWIIKYI